MSGETELARLLQHPAIWRGRSAARTEVLKSGFAALDACLPGGGWPRTGLMEMLPARPGIGELQLLLPALASLSHAPQARWCAWIASPSDPQLTGQPLLPFAPALAAAGVSLGRVLVVRTPSAWAFEQSLGSGACDVVLAWLSRIRTTQVRRLQLAAERGRALGVLFRRPGATRESSPASLRLALEPLPGGIRLQLLKSRGGARGTLDLCWPAQDG